MLDVVRSNKFKKNYQLALKRGIAAKEIDEVLLALIRGEKLHPKHKDHVLVGNFTGMRECHIKNDYLLVYRYEPGKIIFERLGTHSDLFK